MTFKGPLQPKTFCDNQEGRYYILRGPPLALQTVTVVENRECPQHQTSSLCSQIHQENYAFLPNACCLSGSCLSLHSLKWGSIPRK